MNRTNQQRLRDGANRLILAVGNDEQKALALQQVIDSITQKVQNSIASQVGLERQIEPSEEGDRATAEKRRVAQRLAGFDVKGSQVWREISARFGANIKQGELTSIASEIAKTANIRLDRDAKRRKMVLLRWFEENWEQIQPYLEYVVIEETNSSEEQQQPSDEDENPS